MRRIEKEGLIRLAFMYLYCEVHVVAGQPIREVPFDYEFGSFEPAERSEFASAVGDLRSRLSETAEKVMAHSVDGFESLRALGERRLDVSHFDALLRRIPSAEMSELERYLAARARLARMKGRHGVRTLRSANEAIWRELSRGDR
jgi:hypothetical protein